MVEASAGEPATGIVEAAGDRPVDDVVADLDADATDDLGVDDDVEVHVAAVGARERTGQAVAVGVICGFGASGYSMALQYACQQLGAPR